MIEKFLLDIGMNCGTVKNFSTAISEDVRKNDFQHWYFLTPIKVSDKGNGLKECGVQMAFPFLATNGEIEERQAIERITPMLPDYERELLNRLRQMVIVPNYTISIFPFWANEKGERVERKNFAGQMIHIINASVTIRFRESWFLCKC